MKSFFYCAYLTLLAVSNYCICTETTEYVALRSNLKNNEESAWGLTDAISTVGMIFSYKLPEILPFGKNTILMINEFNSTVLPSWLEFSSACNCLIGVPSPHDSGNMFHIAVIYMDKQNDGAIVKDMFSIRIVDRNHFSYGVDNEIDSDGDYKCLPGSQKTYGVIIVSVPFVALPPTAKVKMLTSIAHYLGLSSRDISYVDITSTTGEREIVAGVCDTNSTLHISSWLQWDVGCGYVIPRRIFALEKLENASKDGNFSSLVAGYEVISWCVINLKTKSNNKLKRHANRVITTATPIYALRHPKPNADIPTISLSASKIIKLPQNRIVPTMSSPQITFGQADNSKMYSFRQNTIASMSAKAFVNDLSSKLGHNFRVLAPNRHLFTTELKNGGLEPSVIVNRAMTTIPTVRLARNISTFSYNWLINRTSYKINSNTSGLDKENNSKFLSTEDDILSPIINFEIGTLILIVGRVFTYRIPKNLFSESIDRNLKLSLLNPERSNNSVDQWIKFNESTRTLLALPLTVYHRKYIMSATNSVGYKSNIGFYIDVQKTPTDMNINFIMSVILDTDYRLLINNVLLQIEIAAKISYAFGDKDASKLIIINITSISGLVEIVWTNSSLSSEICSADEIVKLTACFICPNESLNHNFIKSLEPFVIKNAKVVPRRSCNFEIKIAALNKTHSIVIPVNLSHPIAANIHRSRDFVNAILPTIIITAIVLLIAIIALACFCHKHKLRTLRTSPKKGAPVIFDNEIEDKLRPLITDSELL